MGGRSRPPAAGSASLLAALCILTLLPRGLVGKPAEEGDALHRVKRGWVWNQFFVLEEYTGLEPLYIGKVSDAFALQRKHERPAGGGFNQCGGGGASFPRDLFLAMFLKRDLTGPH